MIIMNSINERLFSLLKAKNLKIKDLANSIGINQANISMWKARNTDPPAKYIAPIADFLGVTPEYLLTGNHKYMPLQAAYIQSSVSPPPNLTDEETLLLTNYRKLSLIDKVKVRGLTIELLRAQENAADLDTKKHPIQKGQGA